MHGQNTLFLSVGQVIYRQVISLNKIGWSGTLGFIVCVLTHWGLYKIAANFADDIFLVFICMNWRKISWIFSLMFQLTIFQHWFRLWLGNVLATSLYLSPWWLVYWREHASVKLIVVKNTCWAFLYFSKILTIRMPCNLLGSSTILRFLITHVIW